MESSQKRILIVEDEKHIAFNLELNLKAEGFQISLARDGREAIEKFEHECPFDVILLDVMLPEKNGFEIAEHIRKSDQKVGILMLTARATDEDRLHGLSLGVDDYVTKPFHLDELVMRVKRMAARADFYRASQQSPAKPKSIKSGLLKLDIPNCKLHHRGKEHQLTALETDVLCEFLNHQGEVLSREHLLNKVWGMPGKIETRTVDNFIVRLRRILEENPADPKILISIRGRGYKLDLPSS